MRFDYSEQKIDKIIEKFLNQPKREITQAMLVDLDSIRDKIFNVMDLLEED